MTESLSPSSAPFVRNRSECQMTQSSGAAVRSPVALGRTARRRRIESRDNLRAILVSLPRSSEDSLTLSRGVGDPERRRRISLGEPSKSERVSPPLFGGGATPLGGMRSPPREPAPRKREPRASSRRAGEPLGAPCLAEKGRRRPIRDPRLPRRRTPSHRKVSRSFLR
jgi:hypothetical protein